ncbi:acyl-CoA carboxylase subunit epsilon [Nonomuraea aridisoli]|uniref:Acetyl-CoA carboxylase biotin carboxyl carrier protein subunit n=1 Tax=Nonomuraea aridisoli TaxID=2070368 RepID=A0A2W2E284_9ACTN|nr:acyl-CoA carboxylase subunit epsilon [Nonomuraea aridisoli]PZG16703.1 acetyl-CoA carboxylase biotin carboxyl carrier protein subunit [Nonomuraea aridisoli]
MTPDLRIVRGDATPEEIAALVIVLATRHAQPEPRPVPRSQTWRNPARAMRKPVAPGKSAWRMSALP